MPPAGGGSGTRIIRAAEGVGDALVDGVGLAVDARWPVQLAGVDYVTFREGRTADGARGPLPGSTGVRRVPGGSAADGSAAFLVRARG